MAEIEAWNYSSYHQKLQDLLSLLRVYFWLPHTQPLRLPLSLSLLVSFGFIYYCDMTTVESVKVNFSRLFII